MTESSRSTIVVHGTPASGHTHRVVNFLGLLERPYRLSPAAAEVRASAAFRALNPLGQIPVIEDGDVVIADSHAILVYLARRYAPGTGWLPDEPRAAAEVQRWLAIAAGDIRFGLARARALTLWGGDGSLAEAQALAARILGFLDGHLRARAYLAGDSPTIADVACYGYVARAPEGGVALAPYPAVRAWLARQEAWPRFTPMVTTPIPATGGAR